MDYWRQAAIVEPDHLTQPVTIIGAGGIGSPTAIVLAKMGVRRLTVYDADIIELHNLPNQYYRLDDLTKPKVQALGEAVAAYAGIQISEKNERYSDQRLRGLVISAVDSMASRHAIWQKVRYNASVPLYIDARMAAQVGAIHSVNPVDPDHIRWYEGTLFDDEEALDEQCTNRAIIYNVQMIAALIGNQVKRFARHETVPKELLFDFVSLIFIHS